MILSRRDLELLDPSAANAGNEIFCFPEKVLQFGTGALLRGVSCYFIHKANVQGLFNGRVVAVSPSATDDRSAFDKQNGLYTICAREYGKDVVTEQNIIATCISRVLSASDEWQLVLDCAHNENMQVIILDAAEEEIELIKDDIFKTPPPSFPGKLVSFLYERYKAFSGRKQSGMIIISVEEAAHYSENLESIVMELAHLNGLESEFIDWLEYNNHFCASRVNRITVDSPGLALKKIKESALGYRDDLMITSEVLGSWTIECNEEVEKALSFAKASQRVVIASRRSSAFSVVHR